MAHDEHSADAVGELFNGQTDGMERRAAFVRFVDDHYDLVVRFLLRYGACPDDAKDATQEAFLEAWEKLVHSPGRVIDNPAGWIRRVALNKYRRPPGPRKRPPVASGIPIPDRPEPGPGLAEVAPQTFDVLQVLHRLEDTDRVVMAFCMDGFSSVEAARYLDITPQQARDALKRARRRLARDLAPLPQQEGGTR